MKKNWKIWLKKPYSLAIIGGVLMALPWSLEAAQFLLIFWIPWLLLLKQQAENHTSYPRAFAQHYIAVLTWNALTVWWISGATIVGMIGAFLAMSLTMAIVLSLVLWGWRVKGQSFGLAALLIGWTAFDYFYHNAEIAWPWLSIGNAAAPVYPLVQWYEYTGILGGTVWLLLLNILLFSIITRWAQRSPKQRTIFCSAYALLLILPIALSLHLLAREKSVTDRNPIQVAIVQPNIDPWVEKFSGLTAQQQVDRMRHIADSLLTPSTQLILAPETAIPVSIWEDNLSHNPYIQNLRHTLRKHPQCVWETGTTTLRYYPKGEGKSYTARKLQGTEEGDYYDAYNSAIRIDTSTNVDRYIKSKLVVGVEMIPYPKYLNHIEWLDIDLGGMAGCLGTQPSRQVFTLQDGTPFAPIVCYESIFGEYVTEYVQLGAQFLTVITNDAWWGDTPGHREHFWYSQLRCIETRRYMARCANTGISAIICPTGETSEYLGWWKKGGIRGNLYRRQRMTFYAMHGDYLGRIANALSMLLLLYLLIQTIVRKRHL